jgi:hypothetical protein
MMEDGREEPYAAWEDEACEDWAPVTIISAGVLALAERWPRRGYMK